MCHVLAQRGPETVYDLRATLSEDGVASRHAVLEKLYVLRLLPNTVHLFLFVYYEVMNYFRQAASPRSVGASSTEGCFADPMRNPQVSKDVVRQIHRQVPSGNDCRLMSYLHSQEGRLPLTSPGGPPCTQLNGT